jgi:cytochrome P450
LYYLAKHPDVQEKVRQEVNKIIEENDDRNVKNKGYVPTYEEQKKMEYLTLVLKETLRLSPSVAILPSRKITSECTETFAGMPLKSSSKSLFEPSKFSAMLQLHIFTMQRRHENWKDPLEFRPERFIEENCVGDTNTNGYKWVPFGAGTRVCLGQQFSLVEQRVAISMLLRNYRVQLPNDSPHCEHLRYKPGLLLSPKDLKFQFIKLE